MKVLTLTGSLFGKYELKDEIRLVRIWLDDHLRLQVEPTSPTYAEFASEVRRIVNEKLDKPKPMIYCLTSPAEEELEAQGLLSVTSLLFSRPGNDDFLDTLGQSRNIWGSAGDKNIKGYGVYIGSAKVTEE